MWGFDGGWGGGWNDRLNNAHFGFGGPSAEPMPDEVQVELETPSNILRHMEEIGKIPPGEARTKKKKEIQSKAEDAIKDLNKFLERRRQQERGGGLANQAADREAAMLQGEEAQNALTVYAAVKQKYSDRLREKGGVDRVLNELEEIIIQKLGGDRRYLTDKTKRACAASDFIPGAMGTDNLTEIGRYKAALRCLLDTAPNSSFGNVYHRGSNAEIGTGFRQGGNNAREVLAYMFLAASDPEMELHEDAEKEMGREVAMASELEILISTLGSEIRRGHNDGQYRQPTDLIDEPTCDAGAWGKIFQCAQFNKLTNLKRASTEEQKEEYASPAASFEYKINNVMVSFFEQLPPSQKFEFLNNFNAVNVFRTADADERVGYQLEDFSAAIQNQFDLFWNKLKAESPQLQELKTKMLEAQRDRYRDPVKFRYYQNAYYAQRNHAFHIWCVNMSRLAENDMPDPVHNRIIQMVMKEQLDSPSEEMIREIDMLAAPHKDNLARINKKIEQLRNEYEEINEREPATMAEATLLKAELEALNEKYITLQKEKRECIAIIENIAKRHVAKCFAENVPDQVRVFMNENEALEKEIAPESLVPSVDESAPSGLDDIVVDEAAPPAVAEEAKLEMPSFLEGQLLSQYDAKVGSGMTHAEAAEAVANGPFKQGVKLGGERLDADGIKKLAAFILEKKGIKVETPVVEETGIRFDEGTEAQILANYDRNIGMLKDPDRTARMAVKQQGGAGIFIDGQPFDMENEAHLSQIKAHVKEKKGVKVEAVAEADPPTVAQETDLKIPGHFKAPMLANYDARIGQGESPQQAAESVANRFKGMIQLKTDAEVKQLQDFILKEKGVTVEEAAQSADVEVAPAVDAPAFQAIVPEYPGARKVEYINKMARELTQHWTLDDDGELTHENVYKKALEIYERSSRADISPQEQEWFLQSERLFSQEMAGISPDELQNDDEKIFRQCVLEAYNFDYGEIRRDFDVFKQKALELASAAGVKIDQSNKTRYQTLFEQEIWLQSAKKRLTENSEDDAILRLGNASKSGSVEASLMLVIINNYHAGKTTNADMLRRAVQHADNCLGAHNLKQFVEAEKKRLAVEEAGGSYDKFLEALREFSSYPEASDYSINRAASSMIRELINNKLYGTNTSGHLRLAQVICGDFEHAFNDDAKMCRTFSKALTRSFAQYSNQSKTSTDDISWGLSLLNEIIENDTISAELREEASASRERILQKIVAEYKDTQNSELIPIAAKYGSPYAQLVVLSHTILNKNLSSRQSYEATFQMAFGDVDIDSDALLIMAKKIAQTTDDPEHIDFVRSLEAEYKKKQAVILAADKVTQKLKAEVTAETAQLLYQGHDTSLSETHKAFIDVVEFVYKEYTAVVEDLQRANVISRWNNSYYEKSSDNIIDIAKLLVQNRQYIRSDTTRNIPELDKIDSLLKPHNEFGITAQPQLIVDIGGNRLGPTKLRSTAISHIVFWGAQKRLGDLKLIQDSPQNWFLGCRYLKEAAAKGMPEAIEQLEALRIELHNSANQDLNDLLKMGDLESREARRRMIAFGAKQMSLAMIGDQRAQLYLTQAEFTDSMNIPGITDEAIQKRLADYLPLLDGGGYKEYTIRIQDLPELCANGKPESIKILANETVSKLHENFYQRYKEHGRADDLVHAAQIGNKAAKMECYKKLIEHMLAGKEALDQGEYVTAIDDSVLQAEMDRNSTVKAETIYLRAKEYLSQNDSFKEQFKEIETLYGKSIVKQANEAIRKAHADPTNQAQYLEEARQLIEKAKEFGYELSSDIVLQRYLKEAIDALSINPDWLVELVAEMEDNEENMKLGMGEVQSKIQIVRNEHILDKFKDLFNGVEFTQILIGKTLEYEKIEVQYYELLEREHTLDELEAKVQELEQARQEIETEQQHIQAAFELDIDGIELTDVDRVYINKLFSQSESFEAIEGLNNQNRGKYQAGLSAVERASYIKLKHAQDQDIVMEAHAEVLQALDEFLQKIEDTKDILNDAAEPGNRAQAQHDVLDKHARQLQLLRDQVEGKQYDEMMISDEKVAWLRKEYKVDHPRIKELLTSWGRPDVSVEAFLQVVTDIYTQDVHYSRRDPSMRFNDSLKFSIQEAIRRTRGRSILVSSIRPIDLDLLWNNMRYFKPAEPSAAEKSAFDKHYQQVDTNWSSDISGEKNADKVFKKALELHKEEIQKEIDNKKRPSLNSLKAQTTAMGYMATQMDRELKKAGKMRVFTKAYNKFKKRVNTITNYFGWGNVFQSVDRRLEKEERKAVKEEAKAFSKKMSKEHSVHRKPGFFPMRKKRVEQRQKVDISPQELIMAIKFINNQTDTSRLNIDNEALNEILQKGASARIVGTETNPFKIEISDVAGEKSVQVDLTETQLKNYAKQQIRVEQLADEARAEAGTPTDRVRRDRGSGGSR